MTTVEFKNMVIPVGNKLFHFARVLLKDENEARDAVQEIYIKLWNMREDLASIKNVEAFAMRLTKNWCLDRLKAKKPVFVESYTGRLDIGEESASPHKSLELADYISQFNYLAGQLPEQQRIIIQMRDIQGYEFEEIAEVTGMSVNNIRVSLSRARTKLRENLKKLDNYGQERNRPSTA
ncbi:MAG TPA: sigma-70 family RNA polymerase sigma factor [Bacteroidales bacterium]|nr:sigma-70 family RNA polymerase sigma factor [Bacteroidales bacterium]